MKVCARASGAVTPSRPRHVSGVQSLFGPSTNNRAARLLQSRRHATQSADIRLMPLERGGLRDRPGFCPKWRPRLWKDEHTSRHRLSVCTARRSGFVARACGGQMEDQDRVWRFARFGEAGAQLRSGPSVGHNFTDAVEAVFWAPAFHSRHCPLPPCFRLLPFDLDDLRRA